MSDPVFVGCTCAHAPKHHDWWGCDRAECPCLARWVEPEVEPEAEIRAWNTYLHTLPAYLVVSAILANAPMIIAALRRAQERPA